LYYFCCLYYFQIPYFKKLAKEKVSYLEDKIHTKIAVGTLEIEFPKNHSQGVLFRDEKKDTAAAGKRYQ
jgi:hypothetical protein